MGIVSNRNAAGSGTAFVALSGLAIILVTSILVATVPNLDSELRPVRRGYEFESNSTADECVFELRVKWWYRSDMGPVGESGGGGQRDVEWAYGMILDNSTVARLPLDNITFDGRFLIVTVDPSGLVVGEYTLRVWLKVENVDEARASCHMVISA